MPQPLPKKFEDAYEALGELFIIGFNGLELEDETSAFLSQAKIGGVLLFAHNYESPGQVAELINQIQECRADLPLWISVDHEGGKVQRFKKGFTKIPEAASIAATGSPKLAFEIAEVMAKELKAVGVNLNFAPVADINTNPKNPVIGNRAFGSNDEDVTKYSSAVLRGHIVHGVQACVKHFPGHGDTNSDSHFALPKVETSLETLREREFKPFSRAFKSRCAMVMTAHIICTALDRDRPATLSAKILREILRKELRYSKLIISDDLEMKAITEHFGAEEAPKLAIQAGCDLLIYRTEKAARKAYEALKKALDDGSLAPELVLEAAERSQSLKNEVLMPYQAIAIQDVGKMVGIPEHAEIVGKLSEA